MSQQDNANAVKHVENKPLPGKTECASREPSGLKGRICISKVFGEPMSEEELALWYDTPIFQKMKLSVIKLENELKKQNLITTYSMEKHM